MDVSLGPVSVFAAALNRQGAELTTLESELEEALRQCRRRGRAQGALIGDRIPDYTERDWRVSVPGSGYGSGGGLGTRDPTDVPTTPGQSANDPTRDRGE